MQKITNHCMQHLNNTASDLKRGCLAKSGYAAIYLPS